MEPPTRSPSPRFGHGGRRWLVVSITVVLALATTIGVLAFVPLNPVTAKTGTLTAPGSCAPWCPALHEEDSILLPSGPMVTVNWAEGNQSSVVVTVDNGSLPSCNWNAGAGSCSFRSAGGSYTILMFALSPYVKSLYTVNYTFSYDVPYL